MKQSGSPRRQVASLLALALLVAGTAFAIAYAVQPGQQGAAADPGGPPGPEVTPGPGSPPDTAVDGWYIPYLNAERTQPRFSGVINGIHVGVSQQANPTTPACEGRTEALSAAERLEYAKEQGMLPVPGSLPGTATPLSGPEVHMCGLEVVEVAQHFHVAPTADTNDGGSGLLIVRSKISTTAGIAASERRWRAADVAGRPAAVLDPVVDAGDGAIVGECAAAAIGESGIFTFVVATAARSAFCTRILEAHLQ